MHPPNCTGLPSLINLYFRYLCYLLLRNWYCVTKPLLCHVGTHSYFMDFLITKMLNVIINIIMITFQNNLLPIDQYCHRYISIATPSFEYHRPGFFLSSTEQCVKLIEFPSRVDLKRKKILMTFPKPFPKPLM